MRDKQEGGAAGKNGPRQDVTFLLVFPFHLLNIFISEFSEEISLKTQVL